MIIFIVTSKKLALENMCSISHFTILKKKKLSDDIYPMGLDWCTTPTQQWYNSPSYGVSFTHCEAHPI